MPHLTIEAGPGSGKTFTIEKGYEYLLTNRIMGYTPTDEQIAIYDWLVKHVSPLKPHETVFLAFNKAIQLDMASRLPTNTKAYTFNALGQSIVCKARGFHDYDAQRAQKLCQKMIGVPFNSLTYKDKVYWYNVIKYCSHLKEELRPPDDQSLYFIQDKYLLPDIPNVDDVKKLIHLMLVPNRTLDYSDQVWMGLNSIIARPDSSGKINKMYKVLWCDEAQDLSPLRLEFCLSLAEHCIFCGDPFQSINAFAGADYQAFEKVRAVANNSGGTVLSLKTCFRCPPNVIQRINTIRPARLVAYKTEPGPIETIRLNDLSKRVLQLVNRAAGNELPQEHCSTCDLNLTAARAQNPSFTVCGCDAPTVERYDQSLPENVPEDGASFSNYLMVSRTNANLIRVALELTKHRIPCAIVKKRSDDDNMEEVLKKYLASLKVIKLDQLVTACQNDMHRADSLPFKQGIALRDKAECLLHIAKDCTAFSQIIPKLEGFNTSSTGSIRLSTIHKAKGLEAPFVFILFPPIEHPRATTPNEIEQERNLRFVAESRTKYYTAFVQE